MGRDLDADVKIGTRIHDDRCRFGIEVSKIGRETFTKPKIGPGRFGHRIAKPLMRDLVRDHIFDIGGDVVANSARLSGFEIF